MRVKSTVAAVALALLIAMTAGCTPATPPVSPADNTAAICRQVSERTRPDPEVSRKLAAAYTSGDPASREEARTAQVAMYKSWGTAVQPLEDRCNIRDVVASQAIEATTSRMMLDQLILGPGHGLAASPLR